MLSKIPAYFMSNGQNPFLPAPTLYLRSPQGLPSRSRHQRARQVAVTAGADEAALQALVSLRLNQHLGGGVAVLRIGTGGLLRSRAVAALVASALTSAMTSLHESTARAVLTDPEAEGMWMANSAQQTIMETTALLLLVNGVSVRTAEGSP